jgi:hypothetical protein
MSIRHFHSTDLVWIVWDDTAPPSLLIFSFTIFLFKCLLFCAASSRSVTQRTIRQELRFCTLHNETVRELRLCVIVSLSNNHPTASGLHTLLLIRTLLNDTAPNARVRSLWLPPSSAQYCIFRDSKRTSQLYERYTVLAATVIWTLPFSGLQVVKWSSTNYTGYMHVPVACTMLQLTFLFLD